MFQLGVLFYRILAEDGEWPFDLQATNGLHAVREIAHYAHGGNEELEMILDMLKCATEERPDPMGRIENVLTRVMSVQ